MEAQGALLDVAPERSPIGRIVVVGDPMPMPRARGRVAGPPGGKQWVQIYTPKEADHRKEEFAAAWRELGIPATGQLVELRADFAFMRGSSHFGTGSNATTIKPVYRNRRPSSRGSQVLGPDGDKHTSGGDVDNLLKLVADALSEVAYADDGQAARMIGEKWYTDQLGVDRPQTIVEIWPL